MREKHQKYKNQIFIFILLKSFKPNLDVKLKYI